jgi:hypothetical protein
MYYYYYYIYSILHLQYMQYISVYGGSGLADQVLLTLTFFYFDLVLVVQYNCHAF